MRKRSSSPGEPLPSPRLPEPGKGKRGESGHLGYLLRQAGAALRARMERALSDLDVTPPQFVALTMAAAYPGLSSADLARLSFLTAPTVTVIVGNLKRSGALTSRPHAVHGRIQQLEITEAGKALFARCKRRVDAVEARLAAPLSPDKERVIRRWLAHVARDEAAD
jgi:DNA-binding MarR family transcriptional regulator